MLRQILIHNSAASGGDDSEEADPMGRGRAKAKQTKVARELKYRSYAPDLAALQAELGVGAGEYDEIPEEWADLAAAYLDSEPDDDDDEEYDDDGYGDSD